MLTTLLLVVFINGKPLITRLCLISHWSLVTTSASEIQISLWFTGFENTICYFLLLRLSICLVTVYEVVYILQIIYVNIQNLRWHALDVRFVRVIWGFIWWRYENNFCSFLVKNSTDCIVICNMMILYGSWRNFFLRTSMSIFSLIHALVSL